MKHSILIRFRKITEIATLAQDTCLTIKTFCQAHVPHVSRVHLSMPPGIPNTKQDESVHVGFSDRGEADASKGRFISPLGTWHRFPFDGELFPTRLDGGWRCQPRPHHQHSRRPWEDRRQTCAAHISIPIKVSRRRRREDRVGFVCVFFQILQVVSVTQSVCLIAPVLPTQC